MARCSLDSCTLLRASLIAASALSASCRESTGTVPPRVTSTTVTPRETLLVSIGETAQLEAKSRSGASMVAGDYEWSSRDETHVTVTTQGVVEAHENGRAYVVAREQSGTSDSALVTVKSPLEFSFTTAQGAVHVELTGVFEYLRVGTQFTPRAPLTVRLTSLDPDVLTISEVVIPAGTRETRILTGYPRRRGTARVVASAEGFRPDTAEIVVGRRRLRFGEFDYSARVGVDLYVEATVIYESDDPLRVGARDLLADLDITLISSDPSVLEVVQHIVIPAGEAFGNQGRVRAVGPGVARIYFTATDAITDSTGSIPVEP
jgi:hypothetical protein